MKNSLKYARLTLKHKWFVYLASRKVKCPLRLALLHDLSKFTPAELPHYGRHFFGDKGDPAGFARAWVHHQNANPHHWEYWIPRTAHIRQEQGCKARLCSHQPEAGPYSVWRGESEIVPEVMTYEYAKDVETALNMPEPLPMPEAYVREMIADWMGASKAYTGSWDMEEWLSKNLPKIRLHPDTRALIDRVLQEVR